MCVRVCVVDVYSLHDPRITVFLLCFFKLEIRNKRKGHIGFLFFCLFKFNLVLLNVIFIQMVYDEKGAGVTLTASVLKVLTVVCWITSSLSFECTNFTVECKRLITVKGTAYFFCMNNVVCIILWFIIDSGFRPFVGQN